MKKTINIHIAKLADNIIIADLKDEASKEDLKQEIAKIFADAIRAAEISLDPTEENPE